MTAITAQAADPGQQCPHVTAVDRQEGHAAGTTRRPTSDAAAHCCLTTQQPSETHDLTNSEPLFPQASAVAVPADHTFQGCVRRHHQGGFGT